MHTKGERKPMNKSTSSRIFWDIWKEFAGHFKNKETGSAYLAEIKEFEKFCDKAFLNSGKKDAEAYFEFLGKQEHLQKIQMNTLAKKLWELHSFADFVLTKKEEYPVPKDFCDAFYPLLETVKGQENIVHSVSVEDMDALYQAAQDDIMAYTIIALIHRAGLSSTEISGLRLQDFTVYENGTFAELRGKERVCLIPEDVCRILELYLADRQDCESLFCNRQGNPLNKMYISRMLKKYSIKAKISPLSAEKIRTTCGITMSAYGASSAQVARQMGITGMQIRKYKNKQYRDSLLLKANGLVKMRIEPPD